MSLKSRADQRTERQPAGWPLPLSRQKRKRSEDLRHHSARPLGDGGAKGLEKPGRGRVRRGEEGAAADLARIVAETLA